MVGLVGERFVWRVDRKLESRAEGQQGSLSSHAMATDDGRAVLSLTIESGLAHHTLSTAWARFKTVAGPSFFLPVLSSLTVLPNAASLLFLLSS